MIRVCWELALLKVEFVFVQQGLQIAGSLVKKNMTDFHLLEAAAALSVGQQLKFSEIVWIRLL